MLFLLYIDEGQIIPAFVLPLTQNGTKSNPDRMRLSDALSSFAPKTPVSQPLWSIKTVPYHMLLAAGTLS